MLSVLSNGEIEVVGRIPWSSNATFLVDVRPPVAPPRARGRHGGAGTADSTPMPGDSTPVPAIYKPARGERPLWDFPGGLWKREVAAYQLDIALGWGIVPPTAARDSGPLGPGSLQYCVDASLEEHYFTLVSEPRHATALRTVAAFDLVANNADRKAGHCLLDSTGHVWAIDHGLCFHSEPKLRTVMWDFAGEEIPALLLDALGPLSRGEVPAAVAELLDFTEVAALVARAARTRARRRYPRPSSERSYPWPLV